MFSFEFYEQDQVINKETQSKIYDFLCKLVLNDELDDLYTSNYDFDKYKQIASKYKIKNIQNVRYGFSPYNYNKDNILKYGFHFYFDPNGELKRLDKYDYYGQLENFKEFKFDELNNTNKLVNQVIYNIPNMDLKFITINTNAYTNDGHKLSENLINEISNKIFGNIHKLNSDDFQNNNYDFENIKQILNKHNINQIDTRLINIINHGYNVDYYNESNDNKEQIIITRYHDSNRIFTKSFEYIDNKFTIKNEEYYDYVHHHHKFTSEKPITLTLKSTLEIPNDL